MQLQAKLEYQRETKNKVVYVDERPGAPVDRIYIPKGLVQSEAGYPAAIDVTITDHHGV